MRYLGHMLNKAGFTVSIPRLPGHGTNSIDFQNSNWKDWLRKVTDEYINLKYKYEEVYISGLSMGGVLTLILASKFKPQKIALAAPAVEAKDRKIKLTPYLKYFIKKMDRRNKETYEDENLKELAKEYWHYNWVNKAADLRKLQKISLKCLPQVEADTLTILSKTDGSVPIKVGKIIENQINSKNKKTIILEKSKHVLVNDIKREYVAQEIIKWFKN